jgi:hypothetical protein
LSSGIDGACDERSAKITNSQQLMTAKMLPPTKDFEPYSAIALCNILMVRG